MLPHFISHCKSQTGKLYASRKWGVGPRGAHRKGKKPLKIRDANDGVPGKVELAYLLMSIIDL